MLWLSILLIAIILPPLTLLISLIVARLNVQSLYHDSSTHTDLILKCSPNSITASNIFALFLQIISKYIPTPWMQPAALAAHANGRDFHLPLLRIRGPIHLTSNDEKAFRRAVSLAPASSATSSKDINPDTNLLFLPCLTGPILPLLLSQQSCPVLPLGAVNTRNTFTILRPDLVRSTSALRALDLTFSASFGGPSRRGLRTKRGMEFCIEIDILASASATATNSGSGSDLGPIPGSDPSKARETQVLVRQQLHFLMPLAPSAQPIWQADAHGSASITSAPAPVPAQAAASSTPRISLSLTTTHPRLWAACCRDYNPIHVSGLGARVFGFAAVIAHGNHVVALAIQSLLVPPPEYLPLREQEQQQKQKEEDMEGMKMGLGLQLAREMLWDSRGRSGVEIEVRFLRPVLLPAALQVCWGSRKDGGDRDWDGDGDGVRCVVSKGERVYTVVDCRYV